MRGAVSSSFAGIALGVAVCITGSARAGGPPQRSNDNRAPAEVDPLRRGRQARAAGRWAEAVTAFTAALDSESAARLTEVERAEVTGELGLCELRLARFRDAAEHLARSLDHFMELRPDLRRQIDDARRAAQAQVGRIYVAVSPPDAAVLLDGRPVGRAAATYELFVEPGRHTIRARLGGYAGAVTMFDVARGQKQIVSLELSQTPEPAPRAPEPPPRRPAGAPAGAQPPPAVATSSAMPTVRLTGAVLTGATAAAGGVLLVWAAATGAGADELGAALRRRSWETNRCLYPPIVAACRELHEALRRQDTLSTAGWATLATSGALGALTLASLFVGQRAPAPGGVGVAAWTTGRQSGLLVHGIW